MATPDPPTRAARLQTLRSYLLAEHGYEQGDVSDAELNAAQDRISAELGPRTMAVLSDYLTRSGLGLRDVADDEARLAPLLQLIEDRRRPGFERPPATTLPSDTDLYWTAQRPEGAPDGSDLPDLGRTGARPVALLVMAEYSVDDPVWDRPLGEGGPVDLGELGVSDLLVRQLRAWNQTFERLALSDFEWESPQVESAWVDDGLQLARRLQDELPDLDVRYLHADNDRPLRAIPPQDAGPVTHHP